MQFIYICIILVDYNRRGALIEVFNSADIESFEIPISLGQNGNFNCHYCSSTPNFTK